MRHTERLLIAWLILGVASASGAEPPADASDAPITLEQALAAARSANAQLPVAGLETRIAEQRRLEAVARRRLQVSLDGDLWLAPAAGYDPVVTNLGEERLQVSVEKSLYDGGALRADASRAGFERAASAARFRVAEEDLALDVRQQYAAILAADREVGARREGLERLDSYLELLVERERSGQAVAPDLLRTRVRRATDRAALSAAEESAARARASLDVLMGRSPDDPLEVEPLPPPAAPQEAADDAWRAVPDLDAASADVAAAEAAQRVVAAEKRPQVTVRADAGLWGSDTTRLVPGDFAAAHPGSGFGERLRRDLGYSLFVGVRLPLFDGGAIAARSAAAGLELEQAQQRVRALGAAARLELVSARRALERAYQQYQLLDAAAPLARDAYLLAESRYRGGAATYLEVLDAFSATVETAVAAAQAELAYRTAKALVARWGGVS